MGTDGLCTERGRRAVLGGAGAPAGEKGAGAGPGTQEGTQRWGLKCAEVKDIGEDAKEAGGS